MNRVKITFTGGDEIGDTVERTFADSLLIGRSHSVDVRVREEDVSGRHLEIFCRDGAWCIRNLSRFPAKVDGRQLATGDEAEVKKLSVVEVGRRLRLRMDEIGEASAVAGLDGETCATDAPAADVTGTTRFQESMASRTVATEFVGGETFATRAAPSAAEEEPVAVGQLGESATRDIDTMFDDAATHDDPPNAPAAAFDAGVTGTRPADPSASATGSLNAAPFEDPTETSAGTDSNEGATQEMMTRVGSMDELLERRRQLDRAVAGRHWRFGLLIGLTFLALGAVWFAKSSRKHVEDAMGPFLENGEADVAALDVLGETGAPDLYLEYPRNDRMSVVVAANTNEVEISSFIGRDRDIPFRCWMRRWRDKTELQLSLTASFDRWMNLMAKGKGFSFERSRNGRTIEIEFFDNVFGGFCETTLQSGFTFVRTEFARTTGRVVWRGVCYLFRCGDLTYTICNEIPEMYWKRGGMRLWHEPFFALYADFMRRKWDSPGREELLHGVGEDELIAKIGHALKVEAPGDFVNVELWMDTLLASTWGAKTANADEAVKLRRRFLKAKKKFYDERLLAYKAARLDGNVKQIRSVFGDCLKVFGELKRDRRRTLINNPEVWECQLDQ